MTPRRPLPSRYSGYSSLLEMLVERVEPWVEPGLAILDVGAGRSPTLDRALRPAGRYVGFDLDAAELAAASEGAYDAVRVGDARETVPDFVGSFDMILSAHTWEHIKPLGVALENFRRYLRPGGRLFALFSATFSLHSIVNRILPEQLGKVLIGRPPDTKFRAYYDRCWHSALRREFSDWADASIVPLYCGANYLSFSPLLQTAFVTYENWTCRGDHANLASHYIVEAAR